MSLDNHEKAGTQVQEAIDTLLENRKYFIIGLNDGKVPEESTMFMDILPYADIAEVFVLFDEPKLRCIALAESAFSEEVNAWERACSNMRLHLSGFDKPVLRASDLCSQDPRRFSEIHKTVNEFIFSGDEENLADKLWKIPPRSAKEAANLPSDKEYSELSPQEVEKARHLMQYEISHIAFILFSKGTKILHGRSERRTRQIVRKIAELCSDKEEEERNLFFDPPELRNGRLASGSYPNPYALCDIKNAESILEAILQKGQIPLKASLYLGRAMMFFLEKGEACNLKKYLLKNISDGDMRERIKELKISEEGRFKGVTREEVYLLASEISSRVIWPVEKERIETSRQILGDTRDEKLRSKVRDVLADFSLSPVLNIVVNELMPLIFGKWDVACLDYTLRFLLQTLGGTNGPIENLANESEKKAMKNAYEILEDVYNMIEGNVDNQAYSEDLLAAIGIPLETYKEISESSPLGDPESAREAFMTKIFIPCFLERGCQEIEVPDIAHSWNEALRIYAKIIQKDLSTGCTKKDLVGNENSCCPRQSSPTEEANDVPDGIGCVPDGIGCVPDEMRDDLVGIRGVIKQARARFSQLAPQT